MDNSTVYICDWIDRMTRKYGSTVRDKETGKLMDWGQALCRQRYGVNWMQNQEFISADAAGGPFDDDVWAAVDWEKKGWPKWAEPLDPDVRGLVDDLECDVAYWKATAEANDEQQALLTYIDSLTARNAVLEEEHRITGIELPIALDTLSNDLDAIENNVIRTDYPDTVQAARYMEEARMIMDNLRVVLKAHQKARGE